MVIIYGNNMCNYCLKAKKLAEQYNLKYDWKDTDIDKNLNDLKLKKPDVKTIPQIWWNQKYVGGYEEFASKVTNDIGGFGEGSF